MNMSELTQKEDCNSRAFPVIKIKELRAKIVPVEEDHHRWGTGFQPLLILMDGQADEDGNLSLEEVEYPPSMAIKQAAVAMLQSSTLPNWHHNKEKWATAVRDKSYSKRESPCLWPSCLTEDEEETGASSEDTEGKISLHILWDLNGLFNIILVCNKTFG